MRVAALYDVHGNLPALEAVLKEVRDEGVDQIVVGGDVLPGPMPRETFACLLNLELPVQFIRGNGDREVLAEMNGDASGLPEQYRVVMRWTARQLDPEHQRLLASWPATYRAHLRESGEVLFCHATPRSDTEIFTRRTPDERLAPVFEGLDAALVVCGHTHMQLDRIIGRTRVVNAGSVGMPFGEPGAYWLLLDPEPQLRRTAYDLEKAAERIRGTDYPEAEDFAAHNVMQPPSESEILARFAGAELK